MPNPLEKCLEKVLGSPRQSGVRLFPGIFPVGFQIRDLAGTRVVAQGFTLLEVILSFVLLSIITAVSIPFYESSFARNELTIAEHTLVHALRHASLRASASENDASWGVYIQPSSITIFQGASYDTRDTTADELWDVAAGITPSGVSEILFLKFTGEPQSPGSITLTADSGQTKTIAINAKGMVEY